MCMSPWSLSAPDACVDMHLAQVGSTCLQQYESVKYHQCTSKTHVQVLESLIARSNDMTPCSKATAAWLSLKCYLGLSIQACSSCDVALTAGYIIDEDY